MDFSNGNGFHGSNGFPRPMLARVLGQNEAAIPARPASPAHSGVPSEVWPLAAGVGMLAGGFAVKQKDAKTALFGLGSALTAISTVALFGKL